GRTPDAGDRLPQGPEKTRTQVRRDNPGPGRAGGAACGRRRARTTRQTQTGRPVVNGITPADRWRAIEAEYRSLLDRPLLPAQARRLQELAHITGRTLEWYHFELDAGRGDPL